MTLTLKIELLSDTSFASGRGIPAQLDNNIEHDDHGFPFVSAKRLNGLLADEGRELLASLPESMKRQWTPAHTRLFGQPGSDLRSHGAASVGRAHIPASVGASLNGKTRPTKEQVLAAFTAIRRQTTIDPTTGSPKRRLLRATRVVVRGVWFLATLDLVDSESNEDQELDRAWLAACVSLLRRGGLRRNRGRGRLSCTLWDGNQEVTGRWRTSLLASLRKGA